MQLRYYGQVIRQWFWMIVSLTVLSVLITWGISRQMAPVYQANTLIQVNGSGGTDSGSVYANQALAVSYALLITSNDVLQQVVLLVPGETLQTLQANVSASPEQNTQIIQVRVNADTAARATIIANTVAQVFIAMQIKKTMAPLQQQSEQLMQLMNTQKAQMDSDQTQLTLFQQQNATDATIAHQRDIVNNDEATYNATLNNYQQVQLQLLKAASVVSLVQTAIPPETPVSPRVTLNVTIAAALALVLAITLALLLDWLDTTIKTPEDVERLAGLTALGSVACYKQSIQSAIISADDERAGEIERDFLTIGHTVRRTYTRPQAIFVTATGKHADAGVTTIVSHLALSLAHMGKRVMVIDAHLRQPHLHEVFQLQNLRGLTNSLIGVPHLREEIMPMWLSQWMTAIPNLWCMPAGPEPAQPAALFRAQELRVLLEWLLGQRSAAYALDFVIFDAPALNEHADTLALANLVSTGVLVVEAGREQVDELQAANQNLQRIGAAVAGVIINRQRAYHHPSRSAEVRQGQALAARRTQETIAISPVVFSGLQAPAQPVDTPPLGIRGVEVGSGSSFFNNRSSRPPFAASTARGLPPQAAPVGRGRTPLPGNGKQFIRPLGNRRYTDDVNA